MAGCSATTVAHACAEHAEWELSNNFVFNNDVSSERSFFVNPTLAVKWIF